MLQPSANIMVTMWLLQCHITGGFVTSHTIDVAGLFCQEFAQDPDCRFPYLHS